MNSLNAIPDGEIDLGPAIKITDPTMFNVCLAACAEPSGMNLNNISRYWLEYLHLDVEHNRITGSNGFMMCSAEAVDFSGWDDAVSLLIRPERQLPRGSKSVAVNIKQQFITGIDGYGRSFAIPYRQAHAQYPDVLPLADSIHDDNALLLDSVSFNPRYLMKLMDALNTITVCPIIRPYRINNGNQNAVGYGVDLGCPSINSNYTAIIMPVVNKSLNTRNSNV
jgi:hypothetical protein